MKRTVSTMLAHAGLVLASLFVLYPVLSVLKLALSPAQGFTVGALPIPTQVSLDNFAQVLSQGFFVQLGNSVLVAGGTTLVGIGLACTAAYGFSRLRFPGREAGLATLLLTQIFPGVVMVIPVYLLLDHLKLLDSLAGLVLVYSTTAVPFCTWMLKGYFDTLPKEMEESAMIDGADRWTIFWRISLPLAKPALAVTALFSFMTAWNEFILAYTLLNNPSRFTLPVALQRFVGEHSTEWGLFAAGALMVSLPVMLLFYALQRHLVGGLTAGSVKG